MNLVPNPSNQVNPIFYFPDPACEFPSVSGGVVEDLMVTETSWQSPWGACCQQPDPGD
jgi:hypothetical protein